MNQNGAMLACNGNYMKFKVYHREYCGDDPCTIEADDHEEAAEQYGEEFDCEVDYRILEGKSIEVDVVCEEGIRKRYRVSGEAIPKYYVEKI